MDTKGIKKGFSKRVKSLGLGFSGSQFDFLWEYFESSLLAYRKEVIEEIKSLVKSMPAEIIGDRIYVDYRHLANNLTILSKDTRKKKE